VDFLVRADKVVDYYRPNKTMFVCFISRTFLANEHCFSLIINQRTVLLAIALQPNKQGQVYHTYVFKLGGITPLFRIYHEVSTRNSAKLAYLPTMKNLDPFSYANFATTLPIN
jgi:hypothetical protein